ncbi:hypothetical protein GLOTRDRAFT_140106 [Gloeophyllum trabeum ATCC 11539]|uniref:Uncharacterized protein n=1 Tax=Gloeophyllum trabeum (strain ATCC 11539 / FP-39264 / Madison 617) TaxID=670483 RepID=S7PZX5_GLOTA|nr:uncharacterized protein GLOTRDRAFT_140106 [Gloeophyllum trabeum ATCC 11539]EPQ53231.1 hypothetical protein GLOTRDRAFT_140106 [Gloeophyllum trabeum ATCC 11539]
MSPGMVKNLFGSKLRCGLHGVQRSLPCPDPQTVNRLNGESFQQDALVTFGAYQYAVHYLPSTTNASVRHPALSRRALDGSSSGPWQTATFADYDQTDDDGHNIISLGISPGDGTLHLAFDQHDNPLNYRISEAALATSPPPDSAWANITALFSPVMNFLPNLTELDKDTYFINITYPRFLRVPEGLRGEDKPDLVLELRVGRSGLGDDWLYTYAPGEGWALVGRYLEGVNNNAYINGLDFDLRGNLHVTWTYRDYVNDIGQNVAVEAGPNGPENNHDLNYAFSPPGASPLMTWKNNWGQMVGNLSASDVPLDAEPILPNSAGIVMFGIPKYGGILNQEAQTVDRDGRVHVLNRENTTGVERWYHYWRSTTGDWTRTPLPLTFDPPSVNNVTGTPTVIGKRGKLVAIPPSQSPAPLFDSSFPTTLLYVLPSNAANSSALTILASTAPGHFRDWRVVWEVSAGCGWEPLFDRYRLEKDGVLSFYLVNGTDVGVLDLGMEGL